jgi:hypothetical protein
MEARFDRNHVSAIERPVAILTPPSITKYALNCICFSVDMALLEFSVRRNL